MESNAVMGSDSAEAIRLGPQLPIYDPAGTGLIHPAKAASRAEELGFDIVFVGDHLSFNPPWWEALTCIAVAGTATEKITLGTSVLLAAMRQPAWLAKQIATIQHLTENRLLLGIGVGGENPKEWEGAGVPPNERGRRTNEILKALPDLLAGRETELGPPYDLTIPPLRPEAAMPNIWIGGRADAALKRAARYGEGWLGAFVSPRRVPERIATLSEMAAEYGRPGPKVGLSVFVHITEDVEQGVREATEYFHGLYRLELEKVRPYCLIGNEDEVTEGLVEYARAGVRLFTIVPIARVPFAQYEPLASVRRDFLARVAP